MAQKEESNWIWLLAIGAGLWFLSRPQTESRVASSVASGVPLQSSAMNYQADDQEADSYRIAPITRDTSRDGPDGIRNPPSDGSVSSSGAYPAQWPAGETQVIEGTSWWSQPTEPAPDYYYSGTLFGPKLQ